MNKQYNVMLCSFCPEDEERWPEKQGEVKKMDDRLSLMFCYHWAVVHAISSEIPITLKEVWDAE